MVDSDLIARAEELNDELATATRVADLQFKQALINLAPVMVFVAETAARTAADIRGLIDAFRDLEGQSGTSLGGRLRDLGADRLDIERQILELQNEQRSNASLFSGAENKILDGKIAAFKEQLSALSAEEAKILAILEARKLSQPGTPPVTPGIPEDTGARDKRARAALREAEAVKELIANLEMELALVGASDVERQKANALRQAGAAATEEQKIAIAALVEAIHEETAATEAASAAAQELADLGKSVLGGMIADLKAGKSAAEILAGALDKVADKLLDVALNSIFDGIGKGGGGAFLGTAGRFGIAVNDNQNTTIRRAA